MLVIPTVRVLRSESEEEELVEEPEAVLDWERLRVLALLRFRLEREEKLLLELM